MVLEERKCPNCGSNDVWEKDGQYACMNCKTFFDNPNDIKITRTNVNVSRNETKIEQMKHKERMEKHDDKVIGLIFLGIFGVAIFCLILGKIL